MERQIKRILITPLKVLVDDGKGTVDELTTPEPIHVQMPDGMLVTINELVNLYELATHGRISKQLPAVR